MLKNIYDAGYRYMCLDGDNYTMLFKDEPKEIDRIFVN